MRPASPWAPRSPSPHGPPTNPPRRQRFDEVFAEFTRLEKLMSTWIPDSDVSRVNREAGVRPVPVSAEVREVLTTARQMSEWTGGKFDVTFGALSGLWKFDHDQDNVIPDMRDGAASPAAHRLSRDSDR